MSLTAACGRFADTMKNSDFTSKKFHIILALSHNFRLFFFSFSFFNPLLLIPFFNISTDIVFALYEVYNNALKLGGKLNIIFDRYIVQSGSGGVITREARALVPTYTRRRNMSDITARLGVVVMGFYEFNVHLDRARAAMQRKRVIHLKAHFFFLPNSYPVTSALIRRKI